MTFNPSISVIIPCFNEKNTIEDIISKVNKTPFVKEIIIIDDASSDGTQLILNKLKKKNIKIFFNTKNYGKGYCLRKGIKEAKNDITIFQDADLEYDPAEYVELITPFNNSKTDVVYGSRFLGLKPHYSLYFWNIIANKIITWLSNYLTKLNLTDVETCYKAIKTPILKSLTLKENRFGIEPEITAKLAKKNVVFQEVGISYNGRTVKEGKKITFKDGLSAIWCILKYNLLEK